MDWFTIYAIILGFSVLSTCTCSVILAFQPPSREQKYVAYTIGLFLLFLVGYTACFIGREETLLVFGIKLELLSGFILYMTIYEVFQHVYNVRIPHLFNIVIGLWTLFLLVVCLSFGKNSDASICKAFYMDYYIATAEFGHKVLITVPGWAHTAYFATIILYIGITLMMFGVRISKVKGAERSDSLIFFFCVAVPQFALIILLLAGNNGKGFPLFPLCGAFASIIMTVLIVKQHFTNLLDHAHQVVVNTLEDPMFITDKEYNVRDINNEAKKMFPQFAKFHGHRDNSMKLPQDVQNIVTPPAILSDAEKKNLRLRNNSKLYSVMVTPVDRYSHEFGYVVSLKDMTEQSHKYEQVSASNETLRQELQLNRDKIVTMREKIVGACIQFCLSKNMKIGSHMRRMSNYVMILSRQMQIMGIYNEMLTDYYIDTLVQVAPLHDIGKLVLPEKVLDKNNVFDEKDLRLLKSHVTEGSRIVDRIMIENMEDLYYRLAHEVTLYHHEWWDGSGYEAGLHEQDIPLSARIIAVCDLFDDLTQSSKGEAGGYEKACDSIIKASGTQFDPEIIKAFEKAMPRLMESFTNISGLLPEDNESAVETKNK